MKKITAAFDIDGTLRCNAEERHRTEIEPNSRIVEMLKALAHSKNIEVHLWSNRGADYCREMRAAFELEPYVKLGNCHLKTWKEQQMVTVRGPWAPDDTYRALSADAFRPDISFDDQQSFDGGVFNVIVREK